MGAAGQDYAREHFSWDRIAIQVRQMYDDVLSVRPRAKLESVAH